jgi:hypothetical protein
LGNSWEVFPKYNSFTPGETPGGTVWSKKKPFFSLRYVLALMYIGRWGEDVISTLNLEFRQVLVVHICSPTTQEAEMRRKPAWANSS